MLNINSWSSFTGVHFYKFKRKKMIIDWNVEVAKTFDLG